MPDEPKIENAESGFAELGLRPEILSALETLGYEEPTPIQREAVPSLLAGKDLLGQAATGTGKTAAFALPMLQRIADNRGKTPSALVLVPTRELAMQVAEAVHRYGRSLNITVLPVYGGAAMEQQIRALKRGVDVVIATPGRALDHIRRKTLRLDAVRVVILDEADEMLDMGFAEDLEAILIETPKERQTALFSATMAPRISSIAERHLRNPVRIRIARSATQAGSLPKVRQIAYIVPRAHKMAALSRVLDMEGPESAIVFCRTRTEVDDLTEKLKGHGNSAEALHGGLSQEQRDRVMKRFRAGTTELLIATDVAARGLDIEHLTHVVNYDVPSAPDAYVHRIGRTGRAGREGVAITLAEPREHRLLKNIETVMKQRIEIAAVPTVADLRARRLELTRASLREMLIAGELDGYRVVVESLAGEFDVMDVAAAAVKLAHADDAADAQEIPSSPARDAKSDDGGKARRPEFRGDKPKRDREGERSFPIGDKKGKKGAKGERGKKEVPWEIAKLYVGAGRKAGVRPADIVGAIANEVGVDSSAVGAIEIADRFTLVEVPEEIAEEIIEALRATTIKGKRVPVRRDSGKDR